MPDTIFDAAKKELDKIPDEQLGLTVTATKDDAGVGVEGKKELGKGWLVEGEASWYQKAGWKVAAWLGWTGAQR